MTPLLKDLRFGDSHLTNTRAFNALLNAFKQVQMIGFKWLVVRFCLLQSSRLEWGSYDKVPLAQRFICGNLTNALNDSMVADDG